MRTSKRLGRIFERLRQAVSLGCHSLHATPHFVEALNISQANQDLGLGVQSAAQIAFSLINWGQLGAAENAAQEGMEMAMRAKDKNMRGTALQALASAKMNLGQLGLAFSLYQQAAQTYTNPIDSQLMHAIHGYCESSFGRLNLSRPPDQADFTARASIAGHSLTEWFWYATYANGLARNNHPVDGLCSLTKSLEIAEGMENNHLTIFALEALARGYLRADLRSRRQGLLAKVSKGSQKDGDKTHDMGCAAPLRPGGSRRLSRWNL